VYYHYSESKEIRFVKPFHQITIIGIPGSGKTSISFELSQYWEEQECREDGDCASIYFSYEPSLEELFWDTIETIDTRKLFIVVDDITFYFIKYTRTTVRFLQKLMKIRHRSHAKNFVIILNTHYSKGVLPFLRSSATLIALSITTFEEMERLAKLFGWSPVRDFYYIYTKTVYDTEKRYGLFNWIGQIFISDFKLYGLKSFDYVIGYVDDVKPRKKLIVEEEAIAVSDKKQLN
jgi:hypothetical protein